MLTTYQGVVEEGKVKLFGPRPPDGTLVVVVAQAWPSVEEQIARLRAIPDDEWRKSFDALRRAWDESEPAELEGEQLSTEELVKLVHEARDAADRA